MTPTNPECINSDKVNYGCEALTKVQYGCLQGVCPFFKSKEEFTECEAREKQRCKSLGFHFKSRTEVIEDMNRTTEEQRKRYYKDRKRRNPVTKVIQYNSSENTYIEYSSVDEAISKAGIPADKLSVLLRTGEEWNGYRFTLA